MSRIPFFVIFLALFVFYLFSFKHLAHAALSSCTVSISPTEVLPGSQNSFQFQFNNTSSANIKWIKSTKPFGGITTDGVSLFQWVKTFTPDGSDIVITDSSGVNPLTPGGSITMNATLTVGEVAGSSGNWTIQASDDINGLSPITCTGATDLSISGSAPDTTAPSISGVSASDISDTSATISWSTDESSNSLVEYTVVANFGEYQFSQSSSSLVTSHSVSLTTNIAANTTYYYRVCSTDASGNQGCSGENSFTSIATSSATATPTPTATPASTTTTTTTTATVVAGDTTAPRVTVTTELESTYEEAPRISGRATDDTGVESVDYSTDGGLNWITADETQGLGTEAEYSFVPFVFEDGDYVLIVRAIDAAGNVGVSEELTFVIDRLPPRIGGVLMAMGPQPLLPNSEDVVVVPRTADIKIVLSAVGGPNSIDLTLGDRVFSLVKSPETSLWSGQIQMPENGLFELFSEARDGAGNSVEKSLGRILVVETGRVTSSEGKIPKDATISVYTKDVASGVWTLWDAKTFGQENPYVLGDNSDYSFLLPAGTYYLKIEALGFRSLISEIFSFSESTALNADFDLKNVTELVLFGMRFSFPDLLEEKADVALKVQHVDTDGLDDTGVGAKTFVLPTSNGGTFNLASERGGGILITVVNTWSPPALEQISILQKVIDEHRFPGVIVLNQTSVSKATVFQRKARYNVPFVVDAQGSLSESYTRVAYPAHYFVNSSGIIDKVVSGVLSKEGLSEMLERD